MEEGRFQGQTEDVTKNLFKMCCSILNYKPKQTNQSTLEDQILREYLDQVQENRHQRDTIIIDQMIMLRNIVNRKAFSLTDKQIQLVHKKFYNLCINRKEQLYQKQRLHNKDRIMS